LNCLNLKIKINFLKKFYFFFNIYIMSIKSKNSNTYTYNLPEKLNVNNKSLLLFGGYPVNITSDGNKMTVKSDLYFSEFNK